MRDVLEWMHRPTIPRERPLLTHIEWLKIIREMESPIGGHRANASVSQTPEYNSSQTRVLPDLTLQQNINDNFVLGWSV